VVRSATCAETTFLGPDVPPTSGAIFACAEFLDQQKDGQLLACCGSFPGWAGAEFDPLRRALTRWVDRGVLVVDTYGPPLAWLARLPVALVKINATEARTLFGAAASVESALATHPARLPASSWVVSDGPGLVMFRDGPAGDVQTLKPPVVREISATGSGDVLFAALIHSLYSKHESLREALEKALPLAAANAAHPGIAEFPQTAERQL
jgi:fructose-1-phosphate kinase PfkB-like protein